MAVELGLPVEILVPPVRLADLAWYRWITGHQTAFLGWRALRSALARAAPTSELIALLDLYSVLLLYTGSCSPSVYEQRIRSRMMRWHPAFSGEWAPDHQGIPQALKQAADDRPDLRLARRVNVHVHAAVAERLVPEGGSLLQQTGRPAGRAPSYEEFDLYDRFFDTERGPVCEHALRAQFMHWLLKVVSDVESCGLYYDGPPLSAAVAGAKRENITALEQGALALLRKRLLIVMRESPWALPKMSN
ncbi:hypothetical protein [Actinomadura sp. 9N215]|uniref:hypothetical protein n=1 Tax=Actinomadura sp. 9N215 TaxID=3375150 RepID=UPI0037904DC6